MFPDLSIYAKIVIVFFGILFIFPWVTVPAIAICQFFRVMRMSKVAVADSKLSMVGAQKLGLTMADGGEPIDKKE